MVASVAGMQNEGGRADRARRVRAAVHGAARKRLAGPKLSSARLPEWARDWQRTLFDSGWLVPGWPPELGGRNATAAQQMIYFEELTRLDIPRSLNTQALGIIAPSIRD